MKLYARAATAAGIALLAITGLAALTGPASATTGTTPVEEARLAVPRRCIQCGPPTTCTTTTTTAPTTTSTTEAPTTTTTTGPPVTILVPITVPVPVEIPVPVNGRTEILNAVDVTIEQPEVASPVAYAVTAVVAEPRYTG